MQSVTARIATGFENLAKARRPLIGRSRQVRLVAVAIWPRSRAKPLGVLSAAPLRNWNNYGLEEIETWRIWRSIMRLESDLYFTKGSGQVMPRYHFDLVDSKTIADEGGAEIADEVAAMNAAELLARRLVQDRPELKNRGFAILVTDENGEEVGRFPLDVVH